MHMYSRRRARAAIADRKPFHSASNSNAADKSCWPRAVRALATPRLNILLLGACRLVLLLLLTSAENPQPTVEGNLTEVHSDCNTLLPPIVSDRDVPFGSIRRRVAAHQTAPDQATEVGERLAAGEPHEVWTNRSAEHHRKKIAGALRSFERRDEPLERSLVAGDQRRDALMQATEYLAMCGQHDHLA